MVNCDFSFDNDQKDGYLSGQTLSGAIEITNEMKRSIKGIVVKIEGFAKCHWIEGGGSESDCSSYRAKEDYINNFSYLIGSSNGDPIDLAKGIHKFNFNCALPANLPSSLESVDGDIRYNVKVKIERHRKVDFKFSHPFTVLNPLDLNYENQLLKMPIKTEVSKGSSKKILYISAEIPYRGYVSGQSVHVSVSINNESRVDVDKTTIELMKNFKYTAPNRTNVHNVRISLAEHPGVPSKERKEFRDEIMIPSVPSTNASTCRIVQVFYEILVTAITSRRHINLSVALPITIGNVPLAEIYHEGPLGWSMQPCTSQATYLISQDPNFRSEATDPLVPVPNISPDLPPPSYQEALMTSTQEVDNEERLKDQQAFNPKYPALNFSNQASMSPQTFVPPPYSLPSTDTKNKKK